MKYNFLIITFLLISNLQAQIKIERIDSLGNSILKSSNTTGAFVSILKNDSVIYSQAFGFRDKETSDIFDKETVFPISSNTKAFNATMLLQLDEKGKLAVEKPIIQYLPDIEFSDSYITNHVTTIDLLTHRCGLPRYDFAYIAVDPQNTNSANKEVYDKLKYLKFRSDFRTNFGYGNIQYIISAYIYEQIANEKWEDGLANNILKPLSMNNTHCDYKRFLNTPNKSQGYRNGEKVDVAYNIGLYSVSGVGNMFSTINDLEKWSRFLIMGNDSILSRMYLNFGMTEQFSTGAEEPFDGFSSVGYGLGWFIFDYWGHKVVLHHGENSGHQTIIVLLPDDDISWIIVANEAPKKAGVPFRMTYSLLDIFTNNKLNDWTEKLPESHYENIRYPDSLSDKSLKPKLEISEYCGEYLNDGLGAITIVEKDNKLYAELGVFTAEIKHWKADSFRMYPESIGEDYILHFEIGENNQVISFTTDLVEPSVEMLKFNKRP